MCTTTAISTVTTTITTATTSTATITTTTTTTNYPAPVGQTTAIQNILKFSGFLERKKTSFTRKRNPFQM